MSAIRAIREESVELSFTTHPAGTGRFTLDGSDHLEHRLTNVCHLVLHEIRRIVPSQKLEGLFLGGGYGRGEGGVLQTGAEDHLYNDLEFYVFIRGNTQLNESRYGRALHHLGGQLTPVAGVDVELKIISAAKLRHGPPSMFHYDLIMGHRQFSGGEHLLDGCEHLHHGDRIPLSEATRLLMNRCSGLLFAREKLTGKTFTADDADYVGRNLAKAQLGFGDAVLTAFGQYHWSCLERHDRLRDLVGAKELPWYSDVRRHHNAGIKFKLHPFRAPPVREPLQKLHAELTALGQAVWLWLETRRLGHKFVSVNEYALSSLNKCPERHWWYNCLANAKISGGRGLFKRETFRHPNERLLNQLSLLLWDPRVMFSRGDSAKALNDYRKLWRQLN